MQSIEPSGIRPRETELLIAFADLTLFTRTAAGMSDTELAALCQSHYEQVVSIVEPAGGRVVKFMGDAALIVFPRELADRGARCLLELKEGVDRWMAGRDLRCRLIVKVHAGTAVAGTFGARGTQSFDVIGSDVNRTAVLPSNGFALSVAAFRALEPETRRRFKKHTPPVTYIPLEEKHC